MNRIVRACNPVRVVVFGSYARGEAGPGSDLDLLVVLPRVHDRRAVTVGVRRALADLPVAKDVVVVSAEEAERRRDSPWHIVGQALHEGQTVYEVP
ncbi:MAG: nucleotidyltransferase domain-containing protein [Bacteroidota bacterium]